MSYRDLDIWKLARQIAIAVHQGRLQGVERSHRTDRADIPKLASRIAHLAL